MLDFKRWLEINRMGDAGERSEAILNEIQPKLRSILDQFIQTYQSDAPELIHYFLHSYESTLKTTKADAKNPKYAEKNQNYGRKGFVELQEHAFYREPYYESIFTTLRLATHLNSQQIRIEMNSDFYPFKISIQKSMEIKLLDMINTLPEDIEIWVIDDGIKQIAHSNFQEEVQYYIDKRRNPSIHFGKIIPIEADISDEVVIEQLWDTYVKLAPVRSLLNEEMELHSLATKVLDKFKHNQDAFNINVYGQQYNVKFNETVKSRTHEMKQPFSIYQHDQLIVKGHFHFFHREPTGAKEVLGVKVKNRGMIYTQVRPFLSTSIYEWTYKKSFSQRGRFNENNENQFFQEKAIRCLKEHNYQVNDDNSFLVGRYDNNIENFIEDITDIKKKLITASLIFAEVRGHITLPSEKNTETLPEEDIGDTIDSIESRKISFNLMSILEAVEGSEFTFSNSIIRDFHLNLTCLEDKHFVILNGISGTGKTQLCKLYANAVYGLDFDSENPYLKIIAVRPDWMDATSLFGYYSSFEKNYVRTEFLDTLIKANQEKDRPFFIVLDEMNLAKVEYYLSDYLSAVESKMPIQLHMKEDVTEIPKQVEIPNNIYLIGTINVDETTHSVSDKVLDRAFVMTLTDVDLESYWNTLDNNYKEVLSKEWNVLLDLHRILVAFELHFGYRTMKEMLRKLFKNNKLPEEIKMEKINALDRVIAEKILPKIRGNEQIIPLFDELLTWCDKFLGENSETKKHLTRMRKELDRYGATQYWR